MNIVPYVNLSGKAEETMKFYQGIFGGELEIMRWSEMPPDPKMPVSEEWQNKIMHGTLKISETMEIYFSDSITDTDTPINNNVFLHVNFDTEEELRKAYDALSVGGSINMPVDHTFWGAVYGDLIDKYGQGWGFHYQLPE